MNYQNLLSEKFVNGKSHVTVTRKILRDATDVHFHNFYEIELILGGTGTLMLNGETYPISRGSVFLMTPADFHQLSQADDLDILTFMFDGMLLSSENAERRAEKISISVFLHPTLSI